MTSSLAFQRHLQLVKRRRWRAGVLFVSTLGEALNVRGASTAFAWQMDGVVGPFSSV